MAERLFVYGSLAPGGSNQHILAKIEGTWEKGSVRGFLSNQGWGAAKGFPGIKLGDGGDEVTGMVLTSPQLKDEWGRLDAFEGPDYRRVVVEVLLEDGRKIKSCIYALAGPKVYLATERLLLRQWSEADKPLMQEMQCDPQWMANFPFVRTPEESDAQVKKLTREIEDLGFGFFAMEDKATGEFVGFCGLHVPAWKPPFGDCVEIGWGLRKAWWGRGLVTEAGIGCLDFARNPLALKEVYSFTTMANTKSMAVMERIGLTRVSGGDFMHPEIDPKSPFALHVLYRVRLIS